MTNLFYVLQKFRSMYKYAIKSCIFGTKTLVLTDAIYVTHPSNNPSLFISYLNSFCTECSYKSLVYVRRLCHILEHHFNEVFIQIYVIIRRCVTIGKSEE